MTTLLSAVVKRVTTEALVTRLLFEETRIVGVEYQREGMLHQVKVSQEVILSAGTFDSPKLLMRSGIGDAEQLQALGIAVVADLPGVGQNLPSSNCKLRSKTSGSSKLN